MKLENITKTIRDLIAQGQLEEAANALVHFFDQEMSQIKKTQFHLYNQVINQLSRLSDLKREELTGVISMAETDLKRNKIRVALLEITDSLQDWKEGQAIPPGSQEPLAKARKGIKGWKLFMGVVGIGAIAVLIWFLSKPDEMTGCYIQTDLLTYLVAKPEIHATKIGDLPNRKKYQVLSIKSYQHVGEILFFKIRDKKLGEGWVQEGLQLKYVSPSCLQNRRRTTDEQNTGATNTTPDITPPILEEETFTGCYLETKMLAYLLHRPEVNATKIGTLPQFKKYQVQEVRTVNFGNIRKIHFFKIRDDELGEGWVQETIHLNFISPDCLD